MSNLRDFLNPQQHLKSASRNYTKDSTIMAPEEIACLRELVNHPNKVAYDQLSEIRSQSDTMREQVAHAKQDTKELKRLNATLEQELKEMQAQTAVMQAQVQQAKEDSNEAKKEAKRSFIVSVISIGISLGSLAASIILPIILG